MVASPICSRRNLKVQAESNALNNLYIDYWLVVDYRFGQSKFTHGTSDFTKRKRRGD